MVSWGQLPLDRHGYASGTKYSTTGLCHVDMRKQVRK